MLDPCHIKAVSKLYPYHICDQDQFPNLFFDKYQFFKYSLFIGISELYMYKTSIRLLRRSICAS